MKIKTLEEFDIITKILIYIFMVILTGVTIYCYYDIITELINQRIEVLNELN